MKRHFDPNVVVRSGGRVVERSSDREVGSVQWVLDAFVRRYKNGKSRRVQGWEARTPGGRREMFLTRREAAAWLLERATEPRVRQ